MSLQNLLLMFTQHYFTLLPTWVDPTVMFPWSYTPSDLENASVIVTSAFINKENTKQATTIICSTPTKTVKDDYICTLDGEYYILSLHDHVIMLRNDTTFGRLMSQNVRTHIALLYHIMSIIWHNISFDSSHGFNDEYILRDLSHSYNNTHVPADTRFALVFYGLPHVFQATAPFLKAEWIDPLGCDVYLSTSCMPEVTMEDIYNVYDVKQHILITPEDDVEQDRIWDANKVRHDVNDHRQHMRQFTKINKSKLVLDANQYDYIILMRFDNLMIRPPCIQMLQSNFIYTKMTFFYIVPANLFNEFCCCSDNIYSNTGFCMPSRLKEDGPPHDFTSPPPEYSWLYSPENQCFNHMHKITNGNWYAQIISFICICRSWGIMDIFL